MPSRRSKLVRRPYVKRLRKHGPLEIWLVDGAYIRTTRDAEFSNFGQHGAFPRLIPKDEIWVDQESKSDEHQFFIAHAVLERRLMLRGADYETARRKANAHERKLRVAAGDLRKVRGGDRLPQPANVHERLLKKLGNGLSVWLVNGRLVRSAFDVEFTEGGHEHVYEFVPKAELWLDDDLHEDERGFVLFHELYERELMAKGMDYDSAHAQASKRERRLRQHPAELHQALAYLGWE